MGEHHESNEPQMQHEPGKEPGPPASVTIDVEILDASDPENVICRLSSRDGVVNHDHDRLVFKNDHHHGFWVKFHLTNSDQYSEFVFPTPKPGDHWSDAIWAKPVENETECCPHVQEWTQFKQHKVIDDNRSVVVRNLNEKKQMFKFALRFAKEPDGPVLAICDPVGENQNGSIYRSLK